MRKAIFVTTSIISLLYAPNWILAANNQSLVNNNSNIPKEQTTSPIGVQPSSLTNTSNALMPAESAVQPDETDEINEPANEKGRPITDSNLAGRVFVFGNIGWGSYASLGVNHWIEDQNNFNNICETPMDDINGGGNSNFGVGVWILDYLAFGLEFGSFNAASSGNSGEFQETINLPASEGGFFLRIGHLFWDQLILSGSIGADYLSLGNASLSENNQDVGPFNNSYERIIGATTDLKAYASVEYLLLHNVGLGMDLGYRKAQINDPKIWINRQWQFWSNLDTSHVAIDYSGFFVECGLRLYFPALGHP